MKSVLIKIVILSFSSIFQLYGQSGWRADLRVLDENYIGGAGNKEVNVNMIVDLYYNDVLILPQSNYKYEFFKKYILLPNPEWVAYAPKWGDNQQGTHTYQDSTWIPEGKFDVYCKITLPDNTVINSDVITIPWYSVVPDQKLSSGISFGSIKYWYKDTFRNNNGLNTIYIPRYDAKVLQAETNVVSSPAEKYNYWRNDVSAQTFYNNFVKLSTQALLNTPMSSRFNNTVNSSVRAKVDDLYLDVIKFQDPWLRDYNESPFGIRNRGLAAPLKSLANIDNNLSITSEHQGVLLNQEISSNKPYYTISIPSSIYLPQSGKNHNVYLQNWNVAGATLQYPNSLSTGVVFTSSNGANITANVKATQLSNNPNAFANNSQRKLIKTPDGVMHLVYESMGRIWYETSTDNGQTWQLMNGGKPLDNGAGKCPAIDYSYNNVAIVYQEKSGDNSNLQVKAFIASGGQYVYNFGTTLNSTGLYSSDANPAIGWSSSSKLVIVWKSPSYLSYICGDLDVGIYSSSFTYYDSGIIAESNSLSQYPSISVDKFYVGSINRYALVWQQGPSNGQSAIYYSPISVVYGPDSPPPIEAAFLTTETTIVQPDVIGHWYLVQPSIQNISAGSYPYNYNPSVIILHNAGTRFCWRSQYYPGSNSIVVFKADGNNRFWYFGYNTRIPQITASDDNTEYYIIWNEVYGNSTKFTDNTTLSTIYNLGTTGQAVQLSNGANKNNMYALVFNNQNQPYFFKTTPSIGSKYGLQKSTLASNQIVGRGGIVLKDSVGFFFSVENISVDNQLVDFIEVSDTLVIDDIKQLNNYLISQPFTISGNSALNFNIIYGTTTTTENKILENKNTVSYSLDLIDANSSKLLGNVQKVIFDKNNLPSFETQAFQINSSKLTISKTVQLKLTAQNNFNGQCMLTESYSDILPDELAKLNIKEVGFDDILSVTEYALDQNYPNPFNPSTKISWQSPVASHQTLKVYDILGNEVATLVDEFREAGKYEMNFDASRLASGVYIYKLQAGEFVSSKKMLLLK